MPTAKKRINITVDDRIYEALERLSSERDQSVAGVGLSLIEGSGVPGGSVFLSRCRRAAGQETEADPS
jgi:hypothetical protein